MAAAIALVGAGALATTVVGQSQDVAPLTDRPVVQAEVERTSAAHARAAGVAVDRAKKKKGPKVSYYIQTTPVTVPAGANTPELVALDCPGNRKVVAGYYQTSGGVVADYFSRSDADFKTWLFGFFNVTAAPGQAVGAIVCMTKI
jgi:hypothetical protein